MEKKFEEYPNAENIKMIPIDLCVPNDWNVNAMDETEFTRLTQEIDEDGMLDPIQVVPVEDGKFRIIGGEHRWHACRVLGHVNIPARLMVEEKFQDVDLQQFISMRLNVIKGKINPEKFALLYQQLETKYSKDSLQSLMGFTNKDAWDKLTGGIKEAVRDSLGKEAADKFGDSVKGLKSIDGLGTILNKIMNEHGDTVSHNFVSFSFGGRSGLFIICENSDAYKFAEGITKKCKETGHKADDVFAILLKGFEKHEFWKYATEAKMPESKTDGPGF